MVTRWHGLPAITLLCLVGIVAGQCPVPALNTYSYADTAPGSSGWYSVGSIIKVSCLAGFKRIGTFSTFNCQTAGTWTPSTFPTCNPLSCPKPVAPSNGYITGSYQFNGTITYSCDTGYVLNGNVERHCRSNQSWTGTLPNCQKTVCPSGWMAFAGNCYTVVDSAVTFAQAQAKCRNTTGADLASILNNVEQNFVQVMLAQRNYTSEQRFWIGLTDLDNDGAYIWSQNSKVTDYANWECGQPGSGSSQYNCGTIYAGSSKLGKWVDMSCTAPMSGYVCKQGKIPTVPLVRGNCPGGWYALNSKCYKFEMTAPAQSWDDAALMCKAKYNGTLMSLSDRKHLALFITYINTYYPATSKATWMGYKQIDNEHSPWTWSDLTCTQYTSWGCGEPNNAGWQGEDCMVIAFGKTNRNAGRWNDDNCGSRRQYACEINSPGTSSSVHSPTCDATGLKCPAGWVQFGRSCYYFELNDVQTWPTAGDKCNKMNGAALVSVRDATEQAFLTAHLARLNLTSELKLWMGMNKEVSYNEFTLPDGAVALYRNWDCDYISASSWNRRCTYAFAGPRGTAGKPRRDGYWGADSCSTWSGYNKDGYICEASIPLATQPRYSQGICGAGWIQNGRTCYYLATNRSDQQPWSLARALCQAKGGDLATMKTKEENSFILDYFNFNEPTFKDPIWIGLNVPWPMGTANNQTFYWADNSTLASAPYRHWGCGEPNNYGGTEHCGVIGIGPGNEMSSFWNDDGCQKKFNYVCDKPAPKVSPCKDGWLWNKASSSCYWVETNRTLNFSDAAAACTAQGATLLSVLDATEQKFLTSALAKLPVPTSMNLWMGLHDNDSNKVYAWTDGRHPFYNNFVCGQPGSGGTQGCTTIFAGSSLNGMWLDFPCDTKRGYICKTQGPGLQQLYPLVQGKCPLGWYLFRNECYFFNFNSKRSFDSAQTSCKGMNTNAQLAIMHDDSVLDFFLHYMYQVRPTSSINMYVGLKKPSSFAAFEWQDGSCSSYRRWGCGEPNNWRNSENCGVFGVGAGNHNSAKINDDACYKSQYYVCQMPVPGTSVTPPVCKLPPCPPGWRMYRGTCYYFNIGTARLSYSDASNWCLTRGGALASVTDGSVNTWLSSQLRAYRLTKTTKLWMGWRNDQSTWPDGTSTLYRNWNCPWYSKSGWSDNCGFVFAEGSELGEWGADPCYSWIQADGFICQMNKPRVQATSTYPNFTQGRCDPGWVQFGSQCYLFELNSGRKTSHSGALTACMGKGSMLASISERAQMDFLEKYMMLNNPKFGDPTWIGLYQKTPKDPFRWEDGSKLAFANWGCGEPNDAGGGEDCGVIGWGSGNFFSSRWNDDSCAKNYNYICQKAAASLHPCPAGFFRNHGSCYLFNLSASVDQSTAASACAARGAKLVTIRDRTEQYFLQAILGNLGMSNGLTSTSKQNYWIGLSDTDSDNIYQWPDSTYALYMNWLCGSPGSGGQQVCVAMENSYTSTAGRWNDVSCATKLNGYVCELYVGGSETLITTTQGNCKAGWVQNGNTCYQFKMETADKSTYSEATKLCSGQGAQLLSVHSDNTHAFITSYMTTNKKAYDGVVWLGLTKIQGNRYSAFHWPDGSCFDYNQWGCGEPNDASSGENCGVIGIGNRNPMSGSWNDDSCSQAFNYICERSLNYTGLIGTTQAPKGSVILPACSYSLQCPRGWTKIGQSCYWATTNTKMSWQNAAKDCQTRGGAMASAADTSQLWQLRSFFSKLNVTSSKNLWIGLNNADRSSSYIWPDGSPGLYRNWDCTGGTGSGNCIYANSGTGLWKKAFCSSTSMDGYVCQWSKATPQFTPVKFEQGICAAGWYQRNHLCYKFETSTKQSYSNAQAACTAVNGTLAAIDSAAVQNYLTHYFMQMKSSFAAGLWIGLSQKTRHSQWVWRDGSNTSAYMNWACGEPNDAGAAGEDCAELSMGQDRDSTGLWNDNSCASQSYSICQRPVPQLTPCFYGWEYNAASDSCYRIETTQNLTFTQARSVCQNLLTGADLASVLDPQEQWFLEQQLKKSMLPTGSRLWIGLSDTDNDQYYTWPNGKRNTFSNFDCGISWWSRKPCVYTDEKGVWMVEGCTVKTTGFVCKAGIPKKDQLDMYKLTAGRCDPGFYEFKGRCWKFEGAMAKNANFAGAQADCLSMGGHLAVIRDAYDSSFVSRYIASQYPLVPHKQWTVGYKKITNIFGQFQWVDDSCANYNAWGCSEPNNYGTTGEDCAQYQFGGQTGAVGFTGRWNDFDCKTAGPYICQTPIPKITPPSVTCAAVTCQPGWVPWKGSCYKFVTDDKQYWEDAYTQCLKMNAALLSITDLQEESFVQSQLNQLNLPTEKQLWIGLNAEKNRNIWRWPDNTPAFYRNWECSLSSYDYCTFMYAGFRSSGAQRTGKWGLGTCYTWWAAYQKDGYICESSTPTGMGNVPQFYQSRCPPGWVMFQGTCYYISRDRQNFTNAGANCTSMGGSLVIASTAAKNNFIVDYMIGHWQNFSGSFYIGLYQPNRLSPFVWLDRGVALNHTQYHCGEPNDAGAGEDCTEITITSEYANSGAWNDIACDTETNYICEMVAPPPTTMPTTSPTTIATTTPTTPVPTTTPTTPMPTTQPTTTPPTTPPTRTTPAVPTATTLPAITGDPYQWTKDTFDDWLRRYFPDTLSKLQRYTAGHVLNIGVASLAFILDSAPKAEQMYSALSALRPTTQTPTDVTRNPNENEAQESALGGGGIAGVIIGCIIGALLVVLVVILVVRRQRLAATDGSVAYSKGDESILVQNPAEMSATNPAFDNVEYAAAMATVQQG